MMSAPLVRHCGAALVTRGARRGTTSAMAVTSASGLSSASSTTTSTAGAIRVVKVKASAAAGHRQLRQLSSRARLAATPLVLAPSASRGGGGSSARRLALKCVDDKSVVAPEKSSSGEKSQDRDDEAAAATATQQPHSSSSSSSSVADADASNVVPYAAPAAVHEAIMAHASSFAPHNLLAPFATVPAMWRSMAGCATTAQLTAVEDPHHDPPSTYTYAQLDARMGDFSRGLMAHGVMPTQRVALFAEASSRWVIADGGILAAGAANAVRGSKAPAEELAYIAQHSNVTSLVVDNVAVLREVARLLSPEAKAQICLVVILWGDCPSAVDARLATQLSCPVLSFDDLIAAGAAAKEAATPPAVQPTDLATVVYTSGTTGTPKGVMLTHANLISQVRTLSAVVQPQAGDKTVSLLPPWHAFERTTAYFNFSCGVQCRYTNVANLKGDLADVKPDYLVTVPLVLGTLHGRVRASLAAAPKPLAVIAGFLLAAGAVHVRAMRLVRGVDLRFALVPPSFFVALLARVVALLTAPLHALAGVLVYPKVRDGIGVQKCVVSGGGSLPEYLDDFYEAIGLEVSNGWGLTETSPVIAARTREAAATAGVVWNVRGTVGLPIPGTEVRAIDPETRQPLPDGAQGLLVVRGPGVMTGYLDNPAATASTIDAESGWLDTGDLGWVAPAGVRGSNMAGNVVLVGRAKDTIVLSSGENVEPQPLEDWVGQSPFVKQIMIVGSGERGLGAVVVPDAEAAMAAMGDAAGAGGGDAQAGAGVEEGGGNSDGGADLEVVAADVSKRLAQRPGSRDEEKMPASKVCVLAPERGAWDLDSGCLTRTFKLRRDAIAKRHAEEIAALFKRR
eukprot:CAMPEP_0197614096 /NCGR_PEP_ID=MMETSP1326-20131121/59352_1 /TAXON_ID=1155430 /ORGANISM="Genus nov. species nov., Strain RCC2288" /LENGTH=848 /DNA_ID=CAMNT_0043182965 /DNA_START=77 /DNA_END=2624 /DNA_ORIENTATION=+